jgi:PAS domain S-box-containing protein
VGDLRARGGYRKPGNSPLQETGADAEKGDVSLASLLRGRTPASLLVRRLLPVTVGLPILVGVLRLAGERAGLYNNEFGVAIMVAVGILAGTAALLWTAASLERSDRERRDATEALAHSREHLRSLARNFPDGAIVLFDRDLRHLVADGQGLAGVGLSSAAMEGRTIWEVFPPDVCLAIEPSYRAALAGTESTFEYAYADRSYLVRVVPVRDEASGEVWSGAVMVSDVTDRQRAGEKLRAAEERYRKLVEQLPLVTYIRPLDLASANVYASPQVERMLGYAPEAWQSDPELLGRIVHPDDRERVLADARAVRETGVTTRSEYRYLRPDGRVVWVQDETYLVRDEAGRPVSVEGYLLDITERKDAEEERDRLQADLLHSQKLDAIGQLAGGVAHEFNNMLMAIGGHGSRLLARLGPESEDARHVEQILSASERAAGLTRQLLAFGRKQVLQPRPIDLNEAVDSAIRMLRPLIDPSIELVTTPDPELPRAAADPAQIEQVIVNLVLNARDAIAGGGTISISTSQAFVAEPIAAREGVAHGDFVALTVTDTGAGMDAETRSRIFEPFFTTKPVGKGTGLGLSTVYGIVRQAGGFVTVASTPGRGTTFSVLLSRAEGAADESPAAGSSAPADEPHRGRAIVADDEEVVRKICAELVAGLGYRVDEATDGDEALELLARDRSPVAILLTDVVMPGLGGPELARRVRAVHPDARVVYMSGYPGGELPGDGDLGDEASLLRKPFTAPELEQLLGESTEAAAPPARVGVTCLVADDHPAVLEATCSFLEAQGIDVLARCGHTDDALEQAVRLRPNVAVLDVTMPALGGVEAARRLAEHTAETRVLLFAGHSDRELATEALAAGAHGVLLKSSPLADLDRAIRVVAAGGVYVDPHLVGAVVPDRDPEPSAEGLTSREREVLALLADGHTNEQAARALAISPDTVQTHVRNAMRKLGAESRTQAVASAMRLELIS